MALTNQDEDEDYKAFLALIEQQEWEAFERSCGMFALQVAETDMIAAGQIDPECEELVRLDLSGDHPVALVAPLEGIGGASRNVLAGE